MQKKMNAPDSDLYAILGLDRNCTQTQVRDAYRLLAKLHHPDVNRIKANAEDQIQALNSAYEILSDPSRRKAYDRARADETRAALPTRGEKIERNIAQEVRLRIEDFLRGTSLEVAIKDPANPNDREIYQVKVAAGTAPGSRLRLPRVAPFDGGFVVLRLKAFPSARFKVRGSDLRCDLRISARRAEAGGVETIAGPTGTSLRVSIPPKVKRGELLKIANEGMPKARGGRGDLLVRITYRPEVRISRRP